MEIFLMYEVTRKILWDPHDYSTTTNDMADQLSQGVEPSKHRIMMLDAKYEDESISTRVNMLVMWTMDQTMATLLGRVIRRCIILLR